MGIPPALQLRCNWGQRGTDYFFRSKVRVRVRPNAFLWWRHINQQFTIEDHLLSLHELDYFCRSSASDISFLYVDSQANLLAFMCLPTIQLLLAKSRVWYYSRNWLQLVVRHCWSVILHSSLMRVESSLRDWRVRLWVDTPVVVAICYVFAYFCRCSSFILHFK